MCSFCNFHLVLESENERYHHIPHCSDFFYSSSFPLNARNILSKLKRNRKSAKGDSKVGKLYKGGCCNSDPNWQNKFYNRVFVNSIWLEQRSLGLKLGLPSLKTRLCDVCINKNQDKWIKLLACKLSSDFEFAHFAVSLSKNSCWLKGN